MPYKLGSGSRHELRGVRSVLVQVVERAIELTTQDFCVVDGLRSREEQVALVQRGASKTLHSKHLTGEAVDLVPFINGRPRWEWGPLYDVAAAVQQAAREQGVALRWGGVWDRPLLDLASGADGLEQAVNAYGERRRAAGKRVFLDGPHFELV